MRWLAALLMFGLVSLPAEDSTRSRILPSRWPKEELKRYLALENEWGKPRPAAVASKAMITGTTGPLAVHAGFEALRQGGTAADAALTTSLAQIALSAGGAISYAGMMTAVYYDAGTAKVYTLNAAYNTVQNEKSPRTIPGPGNHSGRTALVPGYVAGVQALHQRFGKLKFAALFSPAIWIAEKGVAVSPPVGSWLVSQKEFITRLPEARRIFTKPSGELYRTGDLLRQPDLAKTLKQVAKQGSAYMYTGKWAEHFVAAVQREGGRMTLGDLAAYRATWTEPLETSFHDYRVTSLGPPSTGGLVTLGALKLAEVAELKRYGHYSRSADTLYYLIQMARIGKMFVTLSPRMLRNYFPGVDPSPEARLTRDTAERIWAYIQKDMTRPPGQATHGPNHSTGVVAVDEQGNVAAILHSSNCTIWGTTGIFVDGVSIPDSAGIQQQEVAVVPPGGRLPDSTNPLIVLKDGKPVLASTAMGLGLHETTLQNLVNILDFGMDPKTSVDQPNFRGASPTEYRKEVIGEGDFSAAILDGLRVRGQPVQIVPRDNPLGYGYWIGIQIDRLGRRLTAGVTSAMNAWAEGY